MQWLSSRIRAVCNRVEDKAGRTLGNGLGLAGAEEFGAVQGPLLT